MFWSDWEEVDGWATGFDSLCSVGISGWSFVLFYAFSVGVFRFWDYTTGFLHGVWVFSLRFRIWVGLP